ncbi:TetR family transcriptional regulator [Alkalibaculum sp. M08DMB]|uniref:TetR family transcriptional regulator n=1 Tax=Alkalibaculum sporogenes TaxID=2655001 RepID=A0A6A7K7U4_9FIRM|nr:TetR/AcrR family transcriptional regulator [Alkalibaculum sporogenes]MPW25466.1 TetR family transcriptional regulator [Alkalibaculum sporogenes]
MTSSKSSNTKKLILDTAYNMINERGYCKTTFREIAKESNLSLGAITHHFKEKSDLAYRLSLLSSKHFYNSITKIIKSHKLDLITGDSVYICTYVKIHLSDDRCMSYYYDLVRDNCLHKISIEMYYMQFLRKFNHLNIRVTNQTVYSCSLVLIGMLSEFVRAKKENHLRLNVEEMVDIYMIQTLSLLQLSGEEIECVMNVTNSLYKNISFDTTDIFNIKLFDNN